MSGGVEIYNTERGDSIELEFDRPSGRFLLTLNTGGEIAQTTFDLAVAQVLLASLSGMVKVLERG